MSTKLNPDRLVVGGEPRLTATTETPFGAVLSVRSAEGGSGPDSVLQQVASAGLRGRGGAWFPTANKWAAAKAVDHPDGGVVVANGGEDEPGSIKDRFLLVAHADLVVEGAALAGFAIGATDVLFYVNHGFSDALAGLRDAIGRAEAAGAFTGVRVGIVEAPSEYVAGEETAALEVLEGRPALPRERPPFPSTQGYLGRPTVVNNIETLANVPGIVSQGASWFRAVGTADTPGTMLFALEGDVPRPGIYELPLGTPLRTLLVDHGGLAADLADVRAVRAGGASSPYLTRQQALELTMDPESFRPLGPLGAGVMRVLGPHRCLVAETLELAAFFARESCGVCPPCRMETTSLHGMLGQVAAAKARPDVFEGIDELFDFAADRGRCGFIRMPHTPLRSALASFHDDFAAHLAGLPCPVAPGPEEGR